ncbi:hypothetical protein WMF20_25475 [Sorangium sp. So ce834]|uniref:hypothetical protein n=1 Tax=Sorangium sp. So ce834 TaxID=3133321 RepID=UPI003F619C76
MNALFFFQGKQAAAGRWLAIQGAEWKPQVKIGGLAEDTVRVDIEYHAAPVDADTGHVVDRCTKDRGSLERPKHDKGGEGDDALLCYNYKPPAAPLRALKIARVTLTITAHRGSGATERSLHELHVVSATYRWLVYIATALLSFACIRWRLELLRPLSLPAFADAEPWILAVISLITGAGGVPILDQLVRALAKLVAAVKHEDGAGSAVPLLRFPVPMNAAIALVAAVGPPAAITRIDNATEAEAKLVDGEVKGRKHAVRFGGLLGVGEPPRLADGTGMFCLSDPLCQSAPACREADAACKAEGAWRGLLGLDARRVGVRCEGAWGRRAPEGQATGAPLPLTLDGACAPREDQRFDWSTLDPQRAVELMPKPFPGIAQWRLRERGQDATLTCHAGLKASLVLPPPVSIPGVRRVDLACDDRAFASRFESSDVDDVRLCVPEACREPLVVEVDALARRAWPLPSQVFLDKRVKLPGALPVTCRDAGSIPEINTARARLLGRGIRELSTESHGVRCQATVPDDHQPRSAGEGSELGLTLSWAGGGARVRVTSDRPEPGLRLTLPAGTEIVGFRIDDVLSVDCPTSGGTDVMLVLLRARFKATRYEKVYVAGARAALIDVGAKTTHAWACVPAGELSFAGTGRAAQREQPLRADLEAATLIEEDRPGGPRRCFTMPGWSPVDCARCPQPVPIHVSSDHAYARECAGGRCFECR